MEEEPLAEALARVALPGPPRLEVLAGEVGTGGPVGLVPGSFDPITRAHVALAQALAVRGAGIALFVYSPRTLPKEIPAPPLLSPERRLAAVAQMCRGAPGLGLAVCSHGLLVDQARAASASFPGRRPVLAVGSDKLRQLFEHRWYRDRDAALRRLFALADVGYGIRVGHEVEAVLAANPQWAERLRRIDLPGDVAAISSTAVRDRVRAGLDVSALVPPEVLPFLDRRPGGNPPPAGG